MSVRKILLDYSEYHRLLDIEKKYEELTKKNTLAKEDQAGEGKSEQAPQNISLIQNTKTENELQTPQPQMIPSITYPPSSSLRVPNLSKKSDKKTLHRGKKEHNWYFLGIPKDT